MKSWGILLLLITGLFTSAQSTFAAPIVPGSFSTTWKTDNPGTSASNRITIPTTGAGYNYNIYWENVASSTQNGTLTGRTGATTITFPAIGTYRVDITGSFPRIYFNNGGDRRKILTIEQWGNIAWTSMENAFYGASNLQGMAPDVPNLAGVTSMSNMFFNASSFNQDISNWDVSNVTSLSQTFYGAAAFNQPLDQWDVSNVTDMTQLFYNATSFNQPLNSWDVSNVTNMILLFDGASAFNQPLDQWDVQPTITLYSMFSDTAFNQDFTTWAWLYNPARTSWGGLLSGASAFTQDISDLVIPSNIVGLDSFFANNLTFNQDISAWDVSNVTDMNSMFWNAAAFNQPINSWDVSNVTNMSYMFQDVTVFNQSLDQWDVSSVTTMNCMFCYSTYNQPLSNWDVSSVADMNYMFGDNAAFNQDLSDWNVSSVPDMYDIFFGTALSTSNYSKILSGWSQQILQTNAGLGDVGPRGSLVPYCSTVQAARDILVTTYSWIITDGGSTPCFTISYSPGLNATLIGQGTQTIVGGEDSTEVEVVPDAGFRFVKWSDESTQNPRTDLAVGANLTVSAIIESDPSGGGGSSATRVGDRLTSSLPTVTIPTTTTTSTSAVATTDSLLDSVAALIDRMRGSEQELKNLPPEEKQKLIALLQAVVIQLLALLASL